MTATTDPTGALTDETRGPLNDEDFAEIERVYRKGLEIPNEQPAIHRAYAELGMTLYMAGLLPRLLAEVRRLRREVAELSEKKSRLEQTAQYGLDRLREKGICFEIDPFRELREVLRRTSGTWSRGHITESDVDLYRRQHDRIQGILREWANYGHTAMKKFREVCHENNKIRRRNERLTTENAELRTMLAGQTVAYPAGYVEAMEIVEGVLMWYDGATRTERNRGQRKFARGVVPYRRAIESASATGGQTVGQEEVEKFRREITDFLSNPGSEKYASVREAFARHLAGNESGQRLLREAGVGVGTEGEEAGSDR